MAAPPAVPKDRDALRRQLASERFQKPGSEKLWSALLGWNRERLARIWLAQAVHDAVRRDAATIGDELLERFPDVAARLTAEDASTAIDLWRSSGDRYTAGEPAPKWQYLANLCAKLDLGSVSAEELQDDWEVWTSVALAAPVRKALLDTLAQAEQMAGALAKGARSANADAVANVVRALWSALAYGDESSLARAREWSDAWLAQLAGAKRD